MKKKMIIIAILLVFSITSFAQTEKGEFLLGGKVDFDRTTQLGYKATSFSFAPEIGYFIAKNLAVGIGLDYERSNFSSQKAITIAAMPFARYYFAEQGKFKFFGQAGAGYAFRKMKGSTYRNRDYSYSSNKFTYKAGLGASYFLTKNIALEGMLQYDNINYGKSLGVSFGLQIHF